MRVKASPHAACRTSHPGRDARISQRQQQSQLRQHRPQEDLQQQRGDIIRQIGQLGDLRPGSITNTSGRCGKSNRRCHRPGQPGHGPHARLTRKLDHKTVSESLSTPAARGKAEREVGEFRKFQQPSREFVEVNTRICQQRPLERETQTPQEKNRSPRSSKKSRAS